MLNVEPNRWLVCEIGHFIRVNEVPIFIKNECSVTERKTLPYQDDLTSAPLHLLNLNPKTSQWFKKTLLFEMYHPVVL